MSEMGATSSDTRRTADCERANLLAEKELEEALDDQACEWLAAHRQICSDCAAVAEAMELKGPIWSALEDLEFSLEAPQLGVDAQILEHLGGSPVAALPIESRPRLTLAAIGLALVMLLPLLTGLRGDLAVQPWTLIGLPVALLIAAFLAVLLAFDRLEQRTFRLVGVAAVVVVPITFFASTFLTEPLAGSTVPQSFLGPAISCGGTGVIIALLVLVPLVVIARRGMAGPTRLGAVLLGVTTAALGAAVLQLHCGAVDVAHILVGHGAAFLLLPLAALLLRVQRRLT